MIIKHEKYVTTKWQYYVDTFYAILPTLLNTGGAMPTFVWLRQYWQTYPVDDKGQIVEMYRVTYDHDPRKI